MKQKELTKTFMKILNWKITFGLHGLQEKISTLKVNPLTAGVAYMRVFIFY